MYQKQRSMGRPRLRNVATLTVATSLAALVLPVQAAVAAEQIQCREKVSIYAAVTGGDLREYFHNTPESGSSDWSPERTIGAEWTQSTVLTGTDGRVYQITNDGELRRYRHTGTEWERPGGGWYKSLGMGWGKWRETAYLNRITLDSNGDFYAIDGTGNLTWSRYDEAASTWTKRVLATGWNRFDMIVAAGDGILYSRDAGQNNGTLYRTQFHADSQRTLTYLKAVGTGGWNMHRRVFSPGADVLYAVQNNAEGTLWWYRWSDTTNTWSDARNIGWGWGADWQIGAMTNSCALSGLPAPVRPSPRPVQGLARSELIEGQSGLVQAFYVDPYGTVKSVTQRPGSAIDFLDTAPIGSPSALSTTPSAIMTKDGQPNVYALATNTDTLEATRGANGITWPALSSFGGWTIGPTKAAKYPDGRRQFFAIDADGHLMARNQNEVDGPVWSWQPIGFSELAGEVTALPAGNDLEVLVTYASGYVVTTRYVNRELTNVRMVMAGTVTGRPAGVVKSDGKVQIFARRADGKIYTVRDTASGLETAWTPIDGVTADGSPSAVISNGRITLAVRSTDGFIYTNKQTSQDGPFAGWTKLTDSRTGNAWPSDTEPSMVALSTGKIVVMYRSADEVTYAFESTPTTAAMTARSASATERFIGGPSPKPKR